MKLETNSVKDIADHKYTFSLCLYYGVILEVRKLGQVEGQGDLALGN
jgi:hypothetical protein